MMKSFYFLPLIVYALTSATHSYSMHTIIKRKKIHSPTQRNYCVKQAVILQRVRSLEIQVNQQREELAHIKALFFKLQNNNQPVKNDHHLDQAFLPDSFIEEYNMHAPVRDLKN